MPTNLLAAAVPLPLGPTGFTRLADAYDALYTGLTSAQPILQGDTDAVPPKINLNAQMLELAFKYGPAGVFGVRYGLELGTPVGLTQVVSKGHGISEALLELADDTNVVLGDDARNYVWFKEDQTLEVVQDDVDPPTGLSVFLGSVLVAGGTAAAADTSGVFKVAGGLAYRVTADLFHPLDTPGVDFPFWTLTQGGFYLWTGSEYVASHGIGVQNQQAYVVASIGSTRTLTRWSANIQRITPTVNNTKILLPADADITFGSWHDIYNDHATNNLLLRDHADTTTIATIAGTQVAYARPKNVAGAAAWPASVTPVAT